MAYATIQHSEFSYAYKVVASDLNQYGIMHGGRLLTLCDEVGYVSACKHDNHGCLTRAVHQARFHRAVHQGDILMLRARVGLTGHSSLWVFVEVISGEDDQCIMDAVFVFAAIDENRKTRYVPAVRAESDAEKELQASLKRMRDQVFAQQG